ncbi:MAG: thioredoxin family protein [Dehalococcoidia bacterium]|nr:thioredoxin family protein [Dehalococcoidia bacterium]
MELEPVASGGTSAAEELVVLPAMTEVVVGTQRLTFGLLDKDGTQLEERGAVVQLYRLEGESDIPRGQYQANFYRFEVETPHVHETGEVHPHLEVRGLYRVPNAAFDAPGFWRADVTLPAVDGRTRKGSMAFLVVEHAGTPALGSAVPATANRTARDVQDLAELTTRTPPEPLFHQVSVAEALQAHRPFVVVFSTPAFCVRRLCGSVLEIVRSVALNVGEKAAFIQIEPYGIAAARNDGKLVLMPASREWGLRSEPWVFVVDAQGRLAAKFEGLLTPEELESALTEVTG